MNILVRGSIEQQNSAVYQGSFEVEIWDDAVYTFQLCINLVPHGYIAVLFKDGVPKISTRLDPRPIDSTFINDYPLVAIFYQFAVAALELSALAFRSKSELTIEEISAIHPDRFEGMTLSIDRANRAVTLANRYDFDRQAIPLLREAIDGSDLVIIR